MKNLLLGLAFVIPMTASALTITVNRTQCSGGGITPTICDGLDQEVRDELNKELPDISIDSYAEGVSNSTSFAAQGQGSDYSDQFDLFTVRTSVGLAVQGDFSDQDSAPEGIGVATSATVGLNLDVLPVDKIGPINLDQFDSFFSISSQSVETDSDVTSIKVDVSSIGAHIRWRFIEPTSFAPFHLLEWGGVQIHTGIVKNSMEIDVTSDFEDQEVESGGQTATFGNSSANVNIESNATTIPIELSTNFRVGYVLTLYTGVGADIVSSDTDISINASGTVSNANYAASISADESGSGEGELLNSRFFLGAQVNIPIFRVYFHANKGLGNDLVGFNTGLKIAW
jgi:hypothetical protein